jgi:hypothetical protein
MHLLVTVHAEAYLDLREVNTEICVKKRAIFAILFSSFKLSCYLKIVNSFTLCPLVVSKGRGV